MENLFNKRLLSLLLSLSLFLLPVSAESPVFAQNLSEKETHDEEKEEKEKIIKWIDFTVTEAALRHATEADIEAEKEGKRISCISLLAYLAAKYGGDFSKYQKKHMDEAVAEAEKRPLEDAATNKKLFRYYQKAYGAVLGGLVGYYTKETEKEGDVAQEKKYGVRCVFPIARGFGYQHFDDFGASRSYGYKRRHLGHDIMGSVGTPIVAVESGYVEALGWNQYGGWRIGIRSFDGLRYYYYAHLKKGHPYADLYEGKVVSAGEVIGYLGMTGYSKKEDVNNIDAPHLHLGLEIIFSPEQKDGYTQIWLDLYEFSKFLSAYRVPTEKAKTNGKWESVSRYRLVYREEPD